MKHSKSIRTNYRVLYNDTDQIRAAEIIFVDGKFENCTFRCSDHFYGLEDWKWLGELSRKIEELVDLETQP